jgi:phage baseplate assembly protein W
MPSRLSHPDAPSYLAFPFSVDWRGRTRETDLAGHVRDLLEQIVFTSPGERVNRPSFGSGVQQALFRPNTELLAETVRATAEASIQQWLGHLIELHALDVEAQDSTLIIEITYTMRNEAELRTARMERAL